MKFIVQFHWIWWFLRTEWITSLKEINKIDHEGCSVVFAKLTMLKKIYFYSFMISVVVCKKRISIKILFIAFERMFLYLFCFQNLYNNKVTPLLMCTVCESEWNYKMCCYQVSFQIKAFIKICMKFVILRKFNIHNTGIVRCSSPKFPRMESTKMEKFESKNFFCCFIRM